MGRQCSSQENRGEGSQHSVQEGSQRGFNCPTCQRSVTIPVGGVKDIPQDLHLDNEVKIAQYQSKVASKDVVPCDVCIDSTSSGPAVGFCCSCHHFMCQLCCDHHKCARNFYQHDVIALGEAVPKERLSAVKPTCDLHSKEFLFYCETCSCLICYDCTTTDHKDHKQNAKLASIASLCKDNISNLIDSAFEIMSQLHGAVDCNIRILNEVEENEETISQNIKQTFLLFHKLLDDRMNKVLRELHDIALSKKTALTLQKERFETLNGDIFRCADVAQTVVEKYTDCEVIALKQLPYAELQGSVSKAQRVSLKPCECSDIVKVALLKNHYENMLPQICHLVDVCPEKSTWYPISLSAINGSRYLLTVEAKDSNGNEYEYNDTQLKVELIQKYSGSLGSAVVLGDRLKRTKGTYSISLTPKDTGPHYLSITMNGQHVQQSPHDLYIEEDMS